jgi:hypothetical protein
LFPPELPSAICIPMGWIKSYVENAGEMKWFPVCIALRRV